MIEIKIEAKMLQFLPL